MIGIRVARCLLSKSNQYFKVIYKIVFSKGSAFNLVVIFPGLRLTFQPLAMLYHALFVYHSSKIQRHVQFNLWAN